MKIHTPAPMEDPRDAGQSFSRLEAIGHDGAFSFEAKGDPFPAARARVRAHDAPFEQLSVTFLVKDAFNDRMPDRKQVRYYAYAGDVSTLRVFPPLALPAEVIRRSKNGGDNDGLVPVESAISGYPPLDDVFPQVLPADHATQIGHGYGHLPVGFQRGFGHLEFYAHLAKALG